MGAVDKLLNFMKLTERRKKNRIQNGAHSSGKKIRSEKSQM